MIWVIGNCERVYFTVVELVWTKISSHSFSFLLALYIVYAQNNAQAIQVTCRNKKGHNVNPNPDDPHNLSESSSMKKIVLFKIAVDH